MDNLIAVDIETKCNVPDCTDKDCKHGLIPHLGLITKIGIWSPTKESVLDPKDFHHLKELIKDKNIVGHNFKFDMKWLHHYGYSIDMEQWRADTEIMAHVFTDKIHPEWMERYKIARKIENEKLPVGLSHRKGSLHTLKCLAPYFLHVDAFWENPADHANNEYVLKDCMYTYKLYEHFYVQLHKKGQFDFYETMLNWTKMLYRAEIRGIQLDINKLTEMETQTKGQVIELKKQLDVLWAPAYEAYQEEQRKDLKKHYTAAFKQACLKLKEPTPEKLAKKQVFYQKLLDKALPKIEMQINLDSPTQMKWLLKSYFKLDVEDYEGDESTGKAVLEKLSIDRPDIKLFLDYRKANKLHTSFFPTYRELNHQGIIRASFNPTGTRTGRLSSSDPNLQQVTKDLKQLFVARPGYKFIGYDAAAIEAKLIALYSDDLSLYDIVTAGQSPHDFNTAKVFFAKNGWEIADIKEKHPKERNASKTLGFSLFYGAGAFRIRNSFMSKGFNISIAEAKELHYKFKEVYEGAIAFHSQITKLFEQGEIIQNIAGRPLTVNAKDAYMTGFNTLIQSSASDLNLAGAFKAQKIFDEKRMDAQVVLFVHDQVVFEVIEDQVSEADKIIVEALTSFKLQNNLGPIKLEVEGGIGERLSDV